MSEAYAAAPELAEPLSATAIQIGNERVTEDMQLVSEFIAEASTQRTYCASYLHPVSVPELMRLALMDGASNEVIAAAMRELRIRLLAHYSEFAVTAAQQAMEGI